MRGRAVALLACAAALGGCTSATRIDAARGDVACEPVENPGPPRAGTVVVMPFEDRTGAGLPRGELAAFGRSYAKILRESKVFEHVYYAGEQPPGAIADDTVRGVVLEADLYRNYAWVGSWLAVYIASFGLLHPLAALVGLPYATDNADLAIEAQLVRARLGPYPGRFEKKVWLNVYDDEPATRGFCTDPRIALQEVTAASVRAMIDDLQRRGPAESTPTSTRRP
jgi:hypothetical protein